MMGRVRWAVGMAVTGLSLTALACSRGEATRAGDAAAAAEEGAAPHDSLIALSAEQRANAGIAWDTVIARSGGPTIEATAEIGPAPDRVAHVGTRVSGKVTAVSANQGDRVGRGQVLAIVDSPELGRAKADYLGALATARVARGTADRERELFDRQISSEREWRQAEAEAVRAVAERDAAENRLHALGLLDEDLAALQSEQHYSSTVELRAPLAGEIVARNITIGQTLEPSDIAFAIMDLREVWLLVDIYEKDLGLVRRGQSAEVTVTAYPGETFRGRVANIGAVLESQSRAVKARVVLANEDRRLKPGMFATVRLQGGASGAAPGLFVADMAVQRDEGNAIVFVPAGPGAFRRVVVRTGAESPGWVEVLGGLKAGDSVVTQGSFILKSELRKSELGEEE